MKLVGSIAGVVTVTTGQLFFFPGTDWPGILAGLRAVHGIKTSRALRRQVKRARQPGLSIIRVMIDGLRAVTSTKAKVYRLRKYQYMNGTFISLSHWKPR